VRFLEHLLWGVRPADPVAFAAAAAILLLAAALASLAPALRILRLDPAQTLRNE
jgi:ABC-type lipoprotein release transport system permease subunit